MHSCDPLTTLRSIYNPFFDQYGVDLVLEGHVHNYQRTFPLKYNPSSPSNPIQTSSSTTSYNDPEGEIYAIVGTAGAGFHGFTDLAPYVVKQQDTKYGYLDILFTNNGATLQAKYYLDDGSVFDQFSITKSVGGDTSPPLVINTDPAYGVTGVPVTKTITATFNEPVLASSVSTSTFIVKNSADVSISGTVSLTQGGTVSTFTPSSSLASSTSYTATIKGGSTGVKDLAGNARTSDKVWPFTTVGDTSPPLVINTDPAYGATGVPVTKTITATFNEPVLASSVSTSTFIVKNSADVSISGTVSLTQGGTVSYICSFILTSVFHIIYSYNQRWFNWCKGPGR